jgi:hypothetical protein
LEQLAALGHISRCVSRADDIDVTRA